ncbi:MAG: iron-sulfur cluster repair di-iron protein [Phycisphaerales bacterium]|nr:iron-sulfur cluster repair di-iron protein [Phycisphaerales bacterium]
MPRVSAETAVGQVVVAIPQAARVFERLRIDYCCVGSSPLGEVCRARGLSPEAVLVMLESARSNTTDLRDWSRASLAELTDHIRERHHEFLRAELPRLSQLLARVVSTHGPQHPELEQLREVFTGFCGDLTEHMIKEERVLFPWLREIESPEPGSDSSCWGLDGLLACLSHDHDDVERALEVMRDLTGGHQAPADAGASFRSLLEGLAELERDMHAHVHLETNILFPLARALEAAGADTGCPCQREEATHACDARRDT